MKVELTDNIVAVIEECSNRVFERSEGNEDESLLCGIVCNRCPLSGACCEHFTGDETVNK